VKKILLAIIMTCCCIGLVTAQGQSDGVNKPLRKSGENPVYNDPARSIEVTIGQEFFIELEANATTGYQWQLTKPLNSSIIELLSTEYRVSENALAGSGGKEIWKFRAIDQGKTIISMKYIRSWEKDVPPAKNVQFRVVIHH